MLILTEFNLTFEMNEVPQQLETDLRYCVLDYSNQNDVDFLFPPLVFLDVFSRPAADLRIGKHRIQVPLDWSIVIADKNMGTMEVIDLKHINDRDFQAFCFNPINGYMPSFYDIDIENIFPNVTWSVPKLKNGHLLAVPLSGGLEPLCAFFLKDINKIPESLDITKLF